MDFFLGVGAMTVAYFSVALTGAWFLRRLELINLGYGLLAGTAAYAFGLVFKATSSFLFATVAAVLGSGATGALLALMALRVTGTDYAISTFAIQVMWVAMAVNSVELVGGPLGISGMPPPPGTQIVGAAWAGFIFAMLISAVVLAFRACEQRTRWPTAAAVVARSIELSRTLGLPTEFILALIGLASGMAFGLFGVFLATYLSFVGVQVFSVQLSITLLALAFLSFAGTVGALFGTILIIAVPELMRLAGFSEGGLSYLRMALVGASILIVVPTLLRHWLYDEEKA